MKDPLVKGHPLHAMLTDLPIGGLVVGVGCDLLGRVLPDRVWDGAARAALGFALVGGVAAAAVGFWDYQAVPREHPARAVGAWHGWLNVAALALLAGSLAARLLLAADLAGLVLGLLAFGLAAVAGWLGGHIVYRLGWRVVPAEHAEQMEEELRQRGDTGPIERAHQKVREYEDTHALIP